MVIKIIEFIFSPFLAFIIGVLFLGLFRKIVARIHQRYGPPIIQPLLDVIKLFHQKGFSHGALFDLGLILSLAGSIVVILFIPFGGICPLKSSGGLLVILYTMLFLPLGIALSGGEGANPNISIGISRKLILSLGYEVPFLLILLSTMSFYRTISIVDIVNSQKNFHWTLFSPLFLSGIAYFMILPAMLGMRPFDIVSAPQEISSGPAVEYGGKYLGLFHIQHSFSIFIMIALFVDLFLGGGENIFYFFLKMLTIFFIMVLIHSVFPRLRLEQALRYLWKWPTIFAFLGVIISKVVR
ncbi:MAG: proton-conducting membrane transporter [Candidatus Aenigmatarchaeota archaeon]|nr:MAG: proton-conducting membrane transporter [Candidatus Aenigmarchaeota archaeon]